MVDVVQVVATAAAMVVVIGGIATAVIAIRRWIQNLAASASRAEQAATVAAEKTTEQLATSNGHTIGQYVEQTATVAKETWDEIQRVRAEITVLADWAGENQGMAKIAIDKAEEAKRIAEATAERLDAHLIGHHYPEAS